MTLQFELEPKLIKQKSFNHKALVEYDENGEISLISYQTKMITIKDDKIIYKNECDYNYTQTTLKHIKEFLYQLLNLKNLTKQKILKLV